MKTFSKRPFLPILSGFLILVSGVSTTHAIIDTNNNGLSDLWEKTYNNGDLLPQSLDPDADPDGDGWTNAQEAIAGTDPFDANAPLGQVCPDILYTSATYSGVDANGDPILITPEAVTITWPTLAGKLYTLQFSANLQAGSWINVQQPVLGDGTPISIVTVLTQPDGSVPPALFWHVRISDVDPDFDDANSYEEFKLGTDSGIADTDGDGTNDGREAIEGTDGANSDVGGSPLIDGRESRWIHTKFVDEPGGGSGVQTMLHTPEPSSSKGAEWLVAKDEFQSIINSSDYALLSAAAAAFPLPEEWESSYKGLWWTNVLKSASGVSNKQEYSAGRMEHRLRINKKSLDVPYEFPMQVLELHWQRDAAASAPWVREQGATNVSILNKAVVPVGDTVSQVLTYPAIPALPVNRAITRTAIHFEEIEPESGFDDKVRFLQAQRFDLPWLAVANSQQDATLPNAQVKMHFSPTDQPLHLEIQVPQGKTATVTPNTTSGSSPLTLSIQGSNSFAGNETSYEGTLRVEGVDVLNLVFYKRRVVTLAVHAITLTNDDQNEKCWYRDKNTGIEHQKIIEVGQGKADAICVQQTTGVLHTTEQGDDYIDLNGKIRTGKDGICQTKAVGTDQQVIPVGEGQPNATIIIPGPNNELNSAANGLISNIQTNGGVAFQQDDVVSGNTITTGPDGIRQTPLPQARVAPVNVPTQAEMQEFLDHVFGRQANIWFQITHYNQADAAFDVASTQGNDANYPALAKPNRIFDFYSFDFDSNGNSYVSREEQIVHAASKDANSTFNLYFIPAKLNRRLTVAGQPRFQSPEGWARCDLRTPYISAFDAINPSDSTSTPILLGAAAHEIAHSKFFDVANDRIKHGLGHPWDLYEKLERSQPDDNFSMIDKDIDSLRLMWFSYPLKLSGGNRFPAKLIKNEADKIHLINK